MYAARKKQKELTIEAIEQFSLEGLPWGKVEVLVTLHNKTNRRRDTDNAIGSLKSMYDGIVLAGIVEDDTPDFMKRAEPVFAIDKKEPRVQITIRRKNETTITNNLDRDAPHERCSVELD